MNLDDAAASRCKVALLQRKQRRLGCFELHKSKSLHTKSDFIQNTISLPHLVFVQLVVHGQAHSTHGSIWRQYLRR